MPMRGSAIRPATATAAIARAAMTRPPRRAAFADIATPSVDEPARDQFRSRRRSVFPLASAAVEGSLTADLRTRPPTLHGEAEFWGLAWPALAWLEANVEAGMATLETGAGASTIVFAARGAEHEAVTPSAEEAERIRAECERRGIATDGLRFRIGSSHEVLPQWEPRPLDLVLVDGAHGFPYPILDWWWLAPHVRLGGRMLLDDAYMPPVAML